MCGITGFVQRRSAKGLLAPMLAKIAHRGPDGEGEWLGERAGWSVALGHRRLSIIDLEGGKQPLSNEDGSLWVTFNGEIYNFKALRDALAARGHKFATHSDTEVLVHQIEEHGEDGLRALNGMFAFALWDGARGRLLLARDRAGIKPLYYATLPDGGLVFASELTSLLAHPAVRRDLSSEGMLSYFFSDYAQAPTTLIDGVKKLPPGCSLTWENGVLGEPRPFWRLGESRRYEAPGGEEEAARELWSRLDTAVDRQLVADVPVGVFLSGGLDSSSIAVLARARASYRIKTFSIGFEAKSFDESGYARAVAKQIGSDHIEQVLSEASLLDVVDRALGSLDEPLADPSFLPTYLLSRLAAQHVKVALGGDGGDELWAGYPTYKAHDYASLYARLPALVRGAIPGLTARLPVRHSYQSLEWKAKRFALRWDDDRVRRHFNWMSNTDLSALRELLPGSRGAAPAVLGGKYPELGDALNDLLAVDFMTYLPGSVLTKVDRASMAHGLEVRPPFLDNDFVDWSFSLPRRWKLRRGRSKYLLKRAALPHLPADVVMRPKKGFAIPLAAWLRGPLRPALQDALGPGRLWDTGLSRDTFVRWNDQHQRMAVDHSKPLWALVVLARWAREQLHGAAPKDKGI